MDKPKFAKKISKNKLYFSSNPFQDYVKSPMKPQTEETKDEYE